MTLHNPLVVKAQMLVRKPVSEDSTLVAIAAWGFHRSDDEVIAKDIDSKGVFTMVLAEIKAFLERGIA